MLNAELFALEKMKACNIPGRGGAPMPTVCSEGVLGKNLVRVQLTRNSDDKNTYKKKVMLDGDSPTFTVFSSAPVL